MKKINVGQHSDTDNTGVGVDRFFCTDTQLYCSIVENLIDIQGRIQDLHTGRAPSCLKFFGGKFWLKNTYTIFY